MSDTTTITTPDWDRVRGELVGAGYQPAHAFEGPAQPRVAATVGYFAAAGWDAVRVNSDTISFARFSDEGARLVNTSPSGVVNTEATFTTDRHGLRMFTVAAELLP